MAREDDETVPVRDPLARRSEDVIPPVEEAKDSLSRFIHSHFRDRYTDGQRPETARISIPANPRRDDDLLLSAFIRWAGRLERAVVLAADKAQQQAAFHEGRAAAWYAETDDEEGAELRYGQVRRVHQEYADELKALLEAST